jgi:DNA-binding GntR family transcriptional regulator
MRRRAEEAGRAALAGDLDVLVHYDLRFWHEIGGLVSNPYVSEFLDRVRVHSWVFSVPYLRRETDLPGAFWQGHLDLVGAIEARDGRAAQAIIQEHNDHSLRMMERLTGIGGAPGE